MSRLKVWAPNAVNVELVKGDDKGVIKSTVFQCIIESL